MVSSAYAGEITLLGLIKSNSLEGTAIDGVMVAISDMAEPRDLPTLIDLLSDRSIALAAYSS